MKFNPVISVFFGVIVSFVLYFIAVLGFGAGATVWGAFIIHSGSSWFGTFLLFASYIVGGFIATYLSRENKIKYGFYEGFVYIVIFLIWSMPIWFLGYNNANIFVYTLFAIFMILQFAVTGGVLGRMADKIYNGLDRPFAIITGSIFGYSCTVLLVLITGHYPGSLYPDAIGIFIGVISFLIVGFVSTFSSKENKIKYGIYAGLLLILINLIQMLISRNIIVPLFEYVIYILSAAIGGYLAILLASHLSKNLGNS